MNFGQDTDVEVHVRIILTFDGKRLSRYRAFNISNIDYMYKKDEHEK